MVKESHDPSDVGPLFTNICTVEVSLSRDPGARSPETASARRKMHKVTKSESKEVFALVVKTGFFHSVT